jgi:hypothetical protein
MNCADAKVKFYHILEVVPPHGDRHELADHIKNCEDCKNAILQELNLENRIRQKIKGIDVSSCQNLLSGILTKIQQEQTTKSSEEYSLSQISIVCVQCSFVWKSVQEFCQDDTVELKEFHCNVLSPEKSKLVFQHNSNCEIVFLSEKFQDLKSGKSCENLLILQPSCRWLCLYPNMLDPCDSECKIAKERSILSHFKKKSRE